VSYGKKIINREIESTAQVFVPFVHALSAVRKAARLFAQVSFVPDLFSRIGADRADSRRREIQLVRELIH
jgi:hypothetical protein